MTMVKPIRMCDGPKRKTKQKLQVRYHFSPVILSKMRKTWENILPAGPWGNKHSHTSLIGIQISINLFGEKWRNIWDFPRGSDHKESVCNAGYPDSIPGSGRSPGERNGYTCQCFCLENSMDRGVWWATVHGVIKKSGTTEL